MTIMFQWRVKPTIYLLLVGLGWGVTGFAQQQLPGLDEGVGASSSVAGGLALSPVGYQKLVDLLQRQADRIASLEMHEADLEANLSRQMDENSALRRALLTHENELQDVREQMASREQYLQEVSMRALFWLRSHIAEVDELQAALREVTPLADLDGLLDRMRSEIEGLPDAAGLPAAPRRSLRNRFAGDEDLARAHPRAGNDLELALALNDVALVFRDKGEPERAEALMFWALLVAESSRGRQHVTTASLLTNIANLYLEKQELKPAQAYYRKALTIYQQQLKPGNPRIADVENRLGTVLKHLKDFPGAQALLMQSIASYEAGPVESRALASGPLHNLGLLYLEQGEVPQAQACLEEALRRIEKTYGARHPLANPIIASMKLARFTPPSEGQVFPGINAKSLQPIARR
jgi:tetratricopeptide (TPR) repeat protein